MESESSNVATRLKPALARRPYVAVEGARYLAWTLRSLFQGPRAAVAISALALVAAGSIAMYLYAPDYRLALSAGLAILAGLLVLLTLLGYVRARLWLKDDQRNATIRQAIEDVRLFTEQRIGELEARLSGQIAAEADSVSLSLVETKRQSRQVLSTLSSRVDTFNLEMRANASRAKDELDAFGAVLDGRFQAHLAPIADRIEASAIQEETTRKRLAITVEEVKARFAHLQARLESVEKMQGGSASASRRDVSSLIDTVSERLAAMSAETRASANKMSASLQNANLRWNKLAADMRTSRQQPDLDDERLQVALAAIEAKALRFMHDAVAPILERLQKLERNAAGPASSASANPAADEDGSNVSPLFAERR